VIPLTRARDIVRFPEFLSLLKTHGIRLVNAHGVRRSTAACCDPPHQYV
jgi:hypothetical protein